MIGCLIAASVFSHRLSSLRTHARALPKKHAILKPNKDLNLPSSEVREKGGLREKKETNRANFAWLFLGQILLFPQVRAPPGTKRITKQNLTI
jgi:hypothetical protein